MSHDWLSQLVYLLFLIAESVSVKQIQQQRLRFMNPLQTAICKVQNRLDLHTEGCRVFLECVAV